MAPQNTINVVLSQKSQEIIGETENTVIIATTYNIKLPRDAQQPYSQQCRVSQVNLLPEHEFSIYISLNEASRISGLSQGVLGKLAKSRRIDSIIVDGRTLVLRKSLDDYMDK